MSFKARIAITQTLYELYRKHTKVLCMVVGGIQVKRAVGHLQSRRGGAKSLTQKAGQASSVMVLDTGVVLVGAAALLVFRAAFGTAVFRAASCWQGGEL